MGETWARGVLDREHALRMDAELVRMTLGQTVARLSIGESLVALGMGWQELGFSTFAGYVRERCARSGRWGEDTRALAARLWGLPGIRARLRSGVIGWCMAEVLARFATAEDEEELLAATRGMTVRQVRRALRERRGPQVPEGEERYGTLDLRLTAEEAWALEATRPMVELIDGRGEPGAWLEAVLAEAQCALSNVAPGADLMPEDVAARHAAWLASIAEGQRCLDRREALAEGSLPPMPMPELMERQEGAGGRAPEEPRGPLEIDRALVAELAPQLASRDLRFGELLARFFQGRGWSALGFASEKQYAQERLGISRSAVHARIALARRTRQLEKVGGALREGAIGYEAATLIARVATAETEAEWVERAKVRTFKHLRQEVNAVEMITRMMRLTDPPGPPTDEEIELVHALERDTKSGAYARRAFGIEREDDAPPAFDALSEKASEAYTAMARGAMVVQDALRSVIARARGSSGPLTVEDAEAACSGWVGSEDDAPVVDLEGDVVSGPAPVVQMFGDVVPGASGARGGDEPAVQMFGEEPAGRTGAAEAAAEADEPAVQMSGEAAAGSAPSRALGLDTVRLRARQETILHFRMLEAAHERAGLGGSFPIFLAVSFWSTWAEVLGRTNACEEVLRRDRYECTSPVCDRPCAPGAHHVVFQSHGGGHELTNRTSPCDWCHLDGVHGGRIRVEGKAPDLTWLIGRPPIMEVRGRERRLLG